MGALKITGQSAEPTVTASDAGTLYYDSDTNKLRHYNGTAWADVSPAAAALTSADLPAGSVIKVEGDTGNTEYTSGTEEWNTKVTDLNVLITPSSASNKILLIGSAPVESSYSGSTGHRVMVDFYKIASDFTETYNLTGEDYGLGQSYINYAAGRQQVTAMTMLDTAGTINEITYSISFKGTGGTVYAGGTDSALTTLTALEIKV